MADHEFRFDFEPSVTVPGGWFCRGCDWSVRAYSETVARDAFDVAHVSPCPSVNIKTDPKQTSLPLLRYPCTRSAGHHGDCVDASGGTWTRLGELLRQDGLVLAGTHVRHLPPCGHESMRRGCGGCDPGAVEFVLDDGESSWRPFDPTIDMEVTR